MSFRDTFTKGSNNRNLQYDDTASGFFLSTLLTIVSLCLFVHLIRKVLSPWGNIPGLKDAEKNPILQPKVREMKKSKKYSFLTFWFVVKSLFLLFLLYHLFSTIRSLESEHHDLKGFDPYEILGVDQFAEPDAVRKAYRKLALKYHPDRNQNDPQKSALFIMITKAYECLTDENVKQNCRKYGNPEGSSSFNVGIALPQFLVRKQNQVRVLAVVMLIFVVTIPGLLLYWHSNMNKFDEYGMLSASFGNMFILLHEQLGIRDMCRIIGMCVEFINRRITREHISGLQQLMKEGDSEMKKLIEDLAKKNYLPEIRRTSLLAYSRMNEIKIPNELQTEFTFLLKECPKLINAIVHKTIECSALSFDPRIRQKNLGLQTIESQVKFLQYFIQGREFGSSSYLQLDLKPSQIQIIEKKKKSKISIRKMLSEPQELEKFLSVIEPERRQYVENNIKMFPNVSCAISIQTEDEQELTNKDFITIRATLNRTDANSFAVTPRYPFLKKEYWYALITINNKPLHFQRFVWDTKEQKTIKYVHRQYLPHGNHTWLLTVLPDCYYDMDVQKNINFTIKKESEVNRKPWTVHEEDKAIEHNEGFLQSIFNSMQKPEDVQLSDDEEEEDKQPNKEQKEETRDSKAVSDAPSTTSS